MVENQMVPVETMATSIFRVYSGGKYLRFAGHVIREESSEAAYSAGLLHSKNQPFVVHKVVNFKAEPMMAWSKTKGRYWPKEDKPAKPAKPVKVQIEKEAHEAAILTATQIAEIAGKEGAPTPEAAIRRIKQEMSIKRLPRGSSKAIEKAWKKGVRVAKPAKPVSYPHEKFGPGGDPFVSPKITRDKPNLKTIRKSKGHIGFYSVADPYNPTEFYLQGDSVFRAPVSNAFDTDGYRHGRWESSKAHWDKTGAKQYGLDKPIKRKTRKVATRLAKKKKGRRGRTKFGAQEGGAKLLHVAMREAWKKKGKRGQ